MGKRVWLHEIVEFLFSKRVANGTLTLRNFFGESLQHQEESMTKRSMTKRSMTKGSMTKHKRATIPIKVA